MKPIVIAAVLSVASPSLVRAQVVQAPIGTTAEVSNDLARASDVVLLLVAGVSESARVSYELGDDGIRFRVESASLGVSPTALAEGEIALGPDGLRRFRITGGDNYARLWGFRERIRALRLPDPDAEVLLDSEQPRFSHQTRDLIGSALPARLLSPADSEQLTVEQIAFQGRELGAALGDEPVAAWSVRVRVGAGSGRRFVLTIDPFTGAVIGAERR